MNFSQEDLDNFLTIVESKLRGPFSSLDISKAVTSTRGLSSRQYLTQLQQVFSRMDKVTKLRVLIAMLGLEPSEEIDDLVYQLLTDAEEDRLSEEWVKVVAGLSRGIMFQDGDGSREPCRGEEAQRMLEKTSREILERVKELKPQDGHDTDPLFAPYYYSLLSTEVLKEVLPECLQNPHFKVNANAAILKEDDELERKKASEAHVPILRPQGATNGTATQVTAAVQEDLPTMPGIRMLNKAKEKPAAAKISSMFMPTKRPGVAAAPARSGPLGKQFNAMHKKPGTARAILAMGRGTGAQGTTSSTQANKFGTNRSKMKMMDLAEVQGLQEEANKQRTETSKETRKRKLLEQMAAKGLVKKAKTASSPAAAKAPNTGDKHTKRATPSNAQPQQQKDKSGQGPAPSTDWTQHLEKSNRLSQEDRERVKLFFVDRVNPTPEVPVVRLKLHEEKTVEPETGLTVKETLYLELDYNTFGFKKLRKIKKK
jgi:hypothetical protein